MARKKTPKKAEPTVKEGVEPEPTEAEVEAAAKKAAEAKSKADSENAKLDKVIVAKCKALAADLTKSLEGNKMVTRAARRARSLARKLERCK